MATYRQPRIDTYTGADALRDLGNLGMQIAFRQIDDKKAKEANRVSLAVNRLASLERRRDRFESSFLDKQAAISGYIGESQNLSDIYKTGTGGKLGSSIQDITFDLYDEPLKYHQQYMEITQNQIDALNPAILSSIDKLAKLSQAEQFLSKGIGATYRTGADEEEKKIWGPEDLGQAAFTEKFYPDLPEGKTIPKELEVFFKRHQPDPTTIAGLEEKRLKALWDLEQRGIARAGAERDVAADKRAQEIHDITIGKKKIPGDVVVNENLDRISLYNHMINLSNTAMLSASIGWSNILSGEREENTRLRAKGQSVFDAESFRIGLLFNPAAASNLGIDPNNVRRLSTVEFEEHYKKLLDRKSNDPKRIRALQVRDIGTKIYHENSQSRKFDPLDVKRGLTVPAYNDRDELIAEAYNKYRDYKKTSSDFAKKYRTDIKYILGIDLQHESSVRGMLKKFFRTNFLESAAGVEGGYDKITHASITPNMRILAGDWMNLVKNKYGYDIIEDKWIESIDKFGQVIYE